MKEHQEFKISQRFRILIGILEIYFKLNPTEIIHYNLNPCKAL